MGHRWDIGEQRELGDTNLKVLHLTAGKMEAPNDEEPAWSHMTQAPEMGRKML